jgi:acetyl-CoA carboxylase biotin carboxyl carrier protein
MANYTNEGGMSMPIEEVITEVAGAVWKILANEGDHVNEGDVLVILESMKMEIPVLAPVDGTVKEILVKVDDVCNEDETLATIEV